METQRGAPATVPAKALAALEPSQPSCPLHPLLPELQVVSGGQAHKRLPPLRAGAVFGDGCPGHQATCRRWSWRLPPAETAFPVSSGHLGTDLGPSRHRGDTSLSVPDTETWAGLPCRPFASVWPVDSETCVSCPCVKHRVLMACPGLGLRRGSQGASHTTCPVSAPPIPAALGPADPGNFIQSV